MKREMFLALVLLATNCANHTASQTNKVAAVDQTARQAAASATPASAGDASNPLKGYGKSKDVPPAFREIDFKNLSYPTSWSQGTIIRLKDGSFERADPMGGNTFDLRDVSYVDLTGDGREEAIVRLSWVSCGGSCDGGSDLFYFYSIDKNRLRLLSRLETGSRAYDCGLKSFVISKRELSLELFGTCRFQGLSFHRSFDADERGRKFIAKSITSFVFEFNGKRFVGKKRTVVPNPEVHTMNYPVRVDISNE